MTAAQPLPSPPDDRSRSEASLSPLREMQLVEAWRRGDGGALGTLLKAYQRRVYGVCYRMLGRADAAEDLAHDALIRMVEGLASYDGRSKLSTWVVRLTMNLCISHLRKERLRTHASIDQPLPGDVADAEPWRERIPARGAEPDALRRVEQAEVQALLHEALGTIDDPLREVLVLRDMHDLSYEQIAEVLEVPVGTVKSRLFRARAALRAALEGAGQPRRIGPGAESEPS